MTALPVMIFPFIDPKLCYCFEENKLFILSSSQDNIGALPEDLTLPELMITIAASYFSHPASINVLTLFSRRIIAEKCFIFHSYLPFTSVCQFICLLSIDQYHNSIRVHLDFRPSTLLYLIDILSIPLLTALCR